jgi:hypothetical protein
VTARPKRDEDRVVEIEQNGAWQFHAIFNIADIVGSWADLGPGSPGRAFSATALTAP